MSLNKLLLLLVLLCCQRDMQAQDYLGRGGYYSEHRSIKIRYSNERQYEAIMSQVDVDAPFSQNVLINTTGWTFTWTYLAVGKYKLTVSNTEGYDLSASSQNVLLEWTREMTDYNIPLMGYIAVSRVSNDGNSFIFWNFNSGGVATNDTWSACRGFWFKLTIYPPP